MTPRRVLAAIAAALFFPTFVFAQAPPTAPLVLTQPVSARATALAGAWVAGRDQDVIFVNPAQLIAARNDFAVSFGHFTDGGNLASIANSYAAGKWSFTLGWGVQMANFMIDPGQTPPFSQDQLFGVRAADAQSLALAIGGAIQYKSFKIGSSLKYASDRTDVNRRAFVADIGVARNFLGGVGAFAVQNLGPDAIDDEQTPDAKLPRQFTGGWSATKIAGPLDLAFFTQLSHRQDWTSPAGGFEVNYSWIEGYAVTGRIGARRPETDLEKPFSFGGAFTADRLTVEYALRLFDDSRRAHVVTIRWR